MEANSRSFGLAVTVAFVAGVVHALRPNLAPLGIQMFHLDATMLSYAVAATAFATLLVNPVGVFLVGYRWGTAADVSSSYAPFLARLFAASVLGFVVIYVPTRLALDADPVSWITYATMVALLLFELVTVPIVALAGSALAEFRFPSRAERQKSS